MGQAWASANISFASSKQGIGKSLSPFTPLVKVGECLVSFKPQQLGQKYTVKMEHAKRWIWQMIALLPLHIWVGFKFWYASIKPHLSCVSPETK
jgi:hypothetical protein